MSTGTLFETLQSIPDYRTKKGRRFPLALYAGRDPEQVCLGGGKQFLAFAGAFGGQGFVVADDQPLTGIVRRGNLRHVALVEERQLRWRRSFGQNFRFVINPAINGRAQALMRHI